MKDQFQCNDENRGLLVERYALGGMSKKEKLAFETHLKTCTFCAKRLQENQKVVDKLKGAAKDAGWSEKDISEIDNLYARAGLSRGINWKLTLKIALILTVVVIIPFTWWANRPATKMALMVSLNRETALNVEDEASIPGLQHAFELHKAAEDDAAIAELKQIAANITSETARITIERLLGLSYLFKSEPDSALPHLQSAVAESNDSDEQMSFIYIAQAHLMMANKLGAVAALNKARQSHQPVPAIVSLQLEKLNEL